MEEIRRIEEFILFHSLYREEKTIIVEGETDKNIYEAVIARLGYDITKVQIRSASSIFFPDKSHEIVCGCYGEIGKIEYLFRHEKLGEKFGNIFGICDRDFLGVFFRPTNSVDLFLTDYCNIESYFLGKTFLNNFFRRVSKCNLLEHHINAFYEICADMFAIRILRDIEGTNKPLVRIGKYIKVTVGKIQFDSQKYFKSWILSCGLSKEKDRLWNNYNEIRKLFRNDPKYYLHKEDVSFLLSQISRTIGKNSIDESSALDIIKLDIGGSELPSSNLIKELCESVFGHEAKEA